MNSAAVQSVKQRFKIIGNDPKLMVAIERALQVAPINLSVLIIGESGVGKEFFPKIIHANSTRKHETYIAVNCGAIPEGTIDSELFGHEKGAFTGAIADHKGYFEEVNGGTIFLDEVAELPLTTQARLLRVLESGEYMRVGSARVQKTDIRIVAATNKDMSKAIKEGKFREDLFYRLSTVQINIPPLRERTDDIWLLTRRFCSDFADNHRTPLVEWTAEAKQALLNYRWPGNVRQLKNVIDQISLFEAGKTLQRADVMRYLPLASADLKPVVVGDAAQFDYAHERQILFSMLGQLQKELQALKSSLGASAPASHLHADVADLKRASKQLVSSTSFKPSTLRPIELDEAMPSAHPAQHVPHELRVTPLEVEEVHTVKTLEDTERETIIKALERNMGRRKRTAEELNISERTLYRKIKEYGLESRNQKN